MNNTNDVPFFFSKEQYDFLKRCAAIRNMSDWNRWRGENPNTEIDLEGADLSDAIFNTVNLDGARLRGANLRNSHFVGAKLNGAILVKANLEESNLSLAEMRGANLSGSHLGKSNLYQAYLEGARIQDAFIQGTCFHQVALDGVTIITGCKFDSETDFFGVGLDSARVDPRLKCAFKSIVRRNQWQLWTKQGESWGKAGRMLANIFWKVSDYGNSTTRIIWVFFILAFGFGVLYWGLSMIPGFQEIIYGLQIAEGQQAFGCLHTLARSLYFSIVTMTTLGFGDMHAAKTGGLVSIISYLLLSIQVILGYVILGSLVTRLGVLFTSDAPAAKPSQTIREGRSH